MIKNQELRLGNYILADGKISYVSTILPYFIQVNDNSRMQYSLSDEDEIIPIPLTEAVLMAAGYVYFDNGEDWGYTNGTRIQVSDYNDEYFYLDILDQGGITLEIKTLHQLQNLIFSLTGKELEINMEELKKAVNG